MEKLYRKSAPKASPRLLFYFGKQPKTAIICKKLFYFERGLSKTFLKSKLYLFFSTQSLLMDKVIKNKRDLELVTSLSSGSKTSSKTKKSIY